jgi:glyoxylase-like metal-dependent hydrolase (beta-lactamase superfamily II)
VLPGISVRLTPGHVPFHQSVLLRNQGETALFVGDLFPTTSHLPLPWIMGYDLEPLRTLESKRTILNEAVAGGWRFIFEHDARIVMGTPVREGKTVVLHDLAAAPEPANVISG